MVTVGIYICTYTSATVTQVLINVVFPDSLLIVLLCHKEQTAEENGGSLTLLVGMCCISCQLLICNVLPLIILE